MSPTGTDSPTTSPTVSPTVSPTTSPTVSPTDSPSPTEKPSCGEGEVGCDRDEYGCIPSAGYSWCELKKECIKPWETPCEESVVPTAAPTDPTDMPILSGVPAPTEMPIPAPTDMPTNVSTDAPTDK